MAAIKVEHRFKRNSSINQVVQEGETFFAYSLYLFYLVSFFLRLPERFPFLGLIRLDLILVVFIGFLIVTTKSTKGSRIDPASRYLLAIVVYALVTLPIVEWPGSVIKNGIPIFIKAAIFYLFTISLVINVERLKATISVFVLCNIIRILEPLALNLTTGYLGSATHLGGSDFAGRLSGAPVDVINPNGLAFVIATVIPFLHYLFSPINKYTRLMYWFFIPVLLYTMGLTLSRSGILALAIIGFGIWVKSGRKVLLLIIGVIGVSIIISNLSDVQKDRYLSLVSSDARQSASAEGRIEGWVEDFNVAMNRPIVGHGLGTSREANWNVAGKDQISHILWMEIWQEIGLIGLILFVLYLSAMISNFREAAKLIKNKLSTDDFLYRSCQAMQVWLLMNLLFSFASYGLKSYEWYLFGGLSVVLLRAVKARVAEISVDSGSERIPDRDSWRFRLARRINRF